MSWDFLSWIARCHPSHERNRYKKWIGSLTFPLRQLKNKFIKFIIISHTVNEWTIYHLWWWVENFVFFVNSYYFFLFLFFFSFSEYFCKSTWINFSKKRWWKSQEKYSTLRWCDYVHLKENDRLKSYLHYTLGMKENFNWSSGKFCRKNSYEFHLKKIEVDQCNFYAEIAMKLAYKSIL